MAEFNIAVIPGDGIGPEIVDGAVKVLKAVGRKYKHKFNFEEVDMGGCAIDKYGTSLPDESLNKALASDSVLLGAVGGSYLAVTLGSGLLRRMFGVFLLLVGVYEIYKGIRCGRTDGQNPRKGA